MIPGLERFRDHFRGLESRYPLIGGDHSSLSAILIDDEPYGWLLNGREEIEGVPIAGAVHLIAQPIDGTPASVRRDVARCAATVREARPDLRNFTLADAEQALAKLETVVQSNA